MLFCSSICPLCIVDSSYIDIVCECLHLRLSSVCLCAHVHMNVRGTGTRSALGLGLGLHPRRALLGVRESPKP